MGAADRFASGQWNFFCDLCGRKEKSSLGVKTWDNHWVCRRHKEVRNPQDFLKGIKDDQTLPWVRSEPPDTYLTYCTLEGTISGPGYAVPGCWVPGKTSTLFPLLPPVITTGSSSIPNVAIPGLAIPNNLT